MKQGNENENENGTGYLPMENDYVNCHESARAHENASDPKWGVSD